MALIRIEGFDAAYRNSLAVEPTTVDAPLMTRRGGGTGQYNAEPSLTWGRLGGYGIKLGYAGTSDCARARMYPSFESSSNTLIMGFALRIETLSATIGRQLVDNAFGTGNHIETLPTPGILRVRINGSTYSMDVTDVQFPLNTWRFVECKVFFDASAGTVEWRMDGATTATYTALNTGSAPTLWTPSLGGLAVANQGKFDFDDFYLCDGSGAANNNFLGDVQVLPLLPNGSGNSSVLLGSDANSVDNFLLVGERALSAGDYVGSTTQGHKDTYDVRAVEFVAVGTGSGTAPGSATPGMPAGAADGDILILVIEAEGEDANADLGPVGWTLVDSVASAIDSAVDRTRCTVYWAWYSPSISLSVPQAGEHTITVVYAFRNVHPTTPFDVTASTGSNATNAVSHSAVTGLTSVTNRTMAVLALTHGDDAGNGALTNAANANLESVWNPGGAASTAGSDGMARILYGSLFTAGAIGTFSWEITGTSHENAWVAMVLRPASEIYASQVFGVQTTASIARTDTLEKYARLVVRSGSTDYVGASQLALTDPSYAPMLGMWEQDPNTSAAWTNSAVQAVEIGVEVRDS